jgi:hypothetical protein
MDKHPECASREHCEQVTALLRALEQRVALSEAHVVSHDTAAREWKARIVVNEQCCDELRRSPQARADPFTGTDGRRLERRIEALEGQP